MKSTTARPLEVQQPTTWIGRVNLGRRMRDAGEKMVADALRERLDKVGEVLWLKECEAEWGWSRTTAYRHLNPDQMEKARVATQEARANVPTVGTSEARPLEEIEADLSTTGLKKPEPATRTCSICGETYPKRDFTKHVEKCPKPTTEPERELTDAEIAENDQAVMDKWSLDLPMGTPKEKRAAKEMVDDAYKYLAGQVDRIVEKDYVVDLTKED